jgi:LmbE family N-acetylglucosaminyl deacetylase
MNWNIDKALVLSAHTDDMELGAGATVRKLVEAGVEVRSIVFSDCKKSVDTENYPIDVLRTECSAAAKHLGIDELTIHEFEVRTFPKFRDSILQLIVKQKKSNNFDLVLSNWVGDIHQDHRVVAEETIRAFMKTETAILQYEIPGNCPSFTPNAFVPITEEQVSQKLEMLRQYESQVVRREYFKEEAIKSHVGYHGHRVGVPYAEGFVQYALSVKSFNGK